MLLLRMPMWTVAGEATILHAWFNGTRKPCRQALHTKITHVCIGMEFYSISFCIWRASLSTKTICQTGNWSSQGFACQLTCQLLVQVCIIAILSECAG